MSAPLASSRSSGVRKVIIFLIKTATSSGMTTSVLGLFSIEEAATPFPLEAFDWAEPGLLSTAVATPVRLTGDDEAGGSLRFWPRDIPAAAVYRVALGGTWLPKLLRTLLWL